MDILRNSTTQSTLFEEDINNSTWMMTVTTDLNTLTNLTTSTIMDEAASQTAFKCSHGLNLLRFVCEVVITMPVAVLGIIGNLLGFVVWHRQQQQSGNTSIILQTLAVIDTLLLALTITMRSVRYIEWCGVADLPNYDAMRDYLYRYGYPMLYIIRMAGTWITTLLTVNRWLAVCHPLHVHRLITRRSVTIQVVVILMLSLLFSIPRYFELYIDHEAREQDRQSVRQTDFSKNKNYTIVYKCVLFLLFMYLIPMVIMIVCNTLLLSALRKTDSYIQGRRHSRRGTMAAQQKNSITVIVVTIVIIFLLCSILALMSHVIYSLEIAFPDKRGQLSLYRRYVSNINNVMITINSAVNFLVYCLCSDNFRQAFLATFSIRRNGHIKRRAASRTSGTIYMSVSRRAGSVSTNSTDAATKVSGVTPAESVIDRKTSLTSSTRHNVCM